jgi:hypothetical protein
MQIKNVILIEDSDPDSWCNVVNFVDLAYFSAKPEYVEGFPFAFSIAIFVFPFDRTNPFDSPILYIAYYSIHMVFLEIMTGVSPSLVKNTVRPVLPFLTILFSSFLSLPPGVPVAF